MITPQKNGSNGQFEVLAAPIATPALVSSVPMVAAVEVGGKRYAVRADVELVTPKMAAEFLARTNKNRKPSKRRVQAYARAMANGEWLVTNQGIGLDVANRLTDGGHRCEAIVESGVSTLMLVVRGLPPETQGVVDFNRPRSASDQGLMFDQEHGKARHAAAQVIHLITSAWSDEGWVWSPAERNHSARRYAAEIDWALGAFPTNSRFVPSGVMGAWAYAYGATTKVAEWVPSFIDGTGMQKGDPLLTLRNVLMNKPKRTTIERRTLALRTLRALWAKLHGESLLKIYDTAEGAIGFMEMRGDDTSKWAGWSSFTRE